MKTKTNVDALRSAAPTRAAKPSEFRKQVVMQLPVALINDLKQRALDLSVDSGTRITQQSLVEVALRKYLYG